MSGGSNMSKPLLGHFIVVSRKSTERFQTIWLSTSTPAPTHWGRTGTSGARRNHGSRGPDGRSERRGRTAVVRRAAHPPRLPRFPWRAALGAGAPRTPERSEGRDGQVVPDHVGDAVRNDRGGAGGGRRPARRGEPRSRPGSRDAQARAGKCLEGRAAATTARMLKTLFKDRGC